MTLISAGYRLDEHERQQPSPSPEAANDGFMPLDRWVTVGRSHFWF